ncbi:uncharacterized protein A1O9_12309 [Exophiala aquamarina CBS 119918]|uniref:VOC domain-containing protein n=1 Tax=Exophiala aquamarina CBS 119918 TaxID=1182545 RepID=A0A072NUW9_9EURO|nr:uncharacterized protein A1O9_12309 [Exophiala aquamarina CBS 119918]KEF51674.1 hypothetical protein A1O9_12309 [Exophiala aquamarina CBS 119918]
MALSKCSLNHVALSVPSVEAAAEWYQVVFGFRRLRDDVLFSRITDPDKVIFKNKFNADITVIVTTDSDSNTVKVAYLVTEDDTGFELFEFIDPPYRRLVPVSERDPSAFTPEMYCRGGFFHIAITVEDVGATCEIVISNGGTQIGKTIKMGSDRALYLKDPWGNVIELLTRNFVDVVRGNQ